jgi:hypothetical protein
MLNNVRKQQATSNKQQATSDKRQATSKVTVDKWGVTCYHDGFFVSPLRDLFKIQNLISWNEI